jgi:hypothetical protein
MKHLRTLLLFALVAFAFACDSDPVRPGDPDPKQTYLPLTTRNAVVNNLEVAWNQRHAVWIDELLDVSFTFYFDPNDVGGGIPPFWNRNDELVATNALFNSNTASAPVGPVCRSIHVDFLADEVTWAELPVSTPTLSEMWYTTTLYYTFTFKMDPDMTFIGQTGAKAVLTVREASEGQWRLVEWRDFDSSVSTATLSTSQTPTWGGVKALYRE